MPVLKFMSPHEVCHNSAKSCSYDYHVVMRSKDRISTLEVFKKGIPGSSQIAFSPDDLEIIIGLLQKSLEEFNFLTNP
jgi:hypothetical protein